MFSIGITGYTFYIKNSLKPEPQVNVGPFQSLFKDMFDPTKASTDSQLLEDVALIEEKIKNSNTDKAAAKSIESIFIYFVFCDV